jgi:hypothetical protein
MAETSAKLRRHFRFSLRTLFAVVTFAAFLLGWLAYQWSWIQARNSARKRHDLLFTESREVDKEYAAWRRQAPLALRLLGEPGVAFIGLIGPPKRAPDELRRASDELVKAFFSGDAQRVKSLLPPEIIAEARELKTLFPEARIGLPRHAELPIVLIE